MKRKIVKIIPAVCISAFLMFSCEKAKIETVETEESAVEAFKSVTTNSDNPVVIIEDQDSKPLLKMHFGPEVTYEEANAIWDAEIKAYMSRLSAEERAFSTEWFFKVWTKTGTQANNDTDGDVGTYVRFTTSVGAITSSFKWMDNFGDDREGGWDAYLFRQTYPNQAIQWVEVDHATLYLEGTDGWFVTDFVIQILNNIQSIPATGFSNCWSHPNVWLDNNCSNSCWDSYYTGNIGTGRVNF